MSKYVKPIVSLDEGMAEGVYAASGCYSASARITQMPRTGFSKYCIHVDGVHNATHTSEGQLLSLSFNQTVTYESSKGTIIEPATGTTLNIAYSYHNNGGDNIGLGDVYVVPSSFDIPLRITGVTITDTKIL